VCAVTGLLPLQQGAAERSITSLHPRVDVHDYDADGVQKQLRDVMQIHGDDYWLVHVQ
jgi:hypothetical protein